MNDKKSNLIIQKHKNNKKYFIWHPRIINISPFIVYINQNKKNLYIYTLSNKKEIRKELYEKNIPCHPSEPNFKKNKTAYAYTKFVKEYKYKKIYYGSSQGKSKISDHYKIKNNGFLLELDNKYVYIGNVGIMEFKLNDYIIKFLTPLGYPVIYGQKNIYHLYNEKSIDILKRNNFKKSMTNSEIEDTYYKIYDFNNPIEIKSIKIKQIKI